VGIPVFLLPGATAACFVAYELFAGRAIRRAAGRSPEMPFVTRRMTLRRKISSGIGATEMRPVVCCPDGTADPLPSLVDAGIASAARADGFVLVPEGSEGYAAGSQVTLYISPGSKPSIA
jgi:molybdopterin molybdotransferase